VHHTPPCKLNAAFPAGSDLAGNPHVLKEEISAMGLMMKMAVIMMIMMMIDANNNFD
jgi:hypothetical protein